MKKIFCKLLRRTRILKLWALGGVSLLAQAADGDDTLRTGGELRVCIWPHYYSISWRNPYSGALNGLDIDMARYFAQELKRPLRFVDSDFEQLVNDVQQGRCDIAMFGIGMTPARQKQLAFSQSYLASDIYAITTRHHPLIKRWEDIDQAGVVVAVQQGTLMEHVMRERLQAAKLQVVKAPNTREAELEAGRADVFMTDYPYSRRVFNQVDWAVLLTPTKPFHITQYAYAVKQDNPVWLARVNQFLSAAKRDGRLQAAALRHGLERIVVGE